MPHDISLSFSLRRNIRRVTHFGLALAAGFLFISVPPRASGVYSRLPVAQGPEPGEQGALVLKRGEPIERELASGQIHRYQITLTADQFAQVVVDQRGIDLEIVLTMPDGARIIADSVNGAFGPDPISWIAAAPGDYSLEVRSPVKRAKNRYEIKLTALGPAGQTERDLAEAFSLYNQSSRLYVELDDLIKRAAAAADIARKYEEAIAACERARDIQARALGENHPDLALTLYHLGSLHAMRRQPGDSAKATQLFQTAVTIWEKERGAEFLGLLIPLNRLAVLYKEAENYAGAQSAFDLALGICEKRFPPDSIGLAAARFNRGELYVRQRELAKAEQLLEMALKTFVARAGREDVVYTSRCRDLLTSVYADHDRYDQAEALFKESLDIVTKARGAEHTEVADLLNNFAALYHRKGDFARAEELNLRALRIREAKLPPNHPAIALSLHNLAATHADAGDYTQAERMLERSLEINKIAYGLNNRYVAKSLHNFGVFYIRKGDYAKSEQFLQQSLDISKRLPPSGNVNLDIASSLDNLGALYAHRAKQSQAEGDYAKAEQCFNDALQTRLKLEADHPSIALSFNHLAGLYLARGDYARAEPLFTQALKIVEQRLGPDHPDTAILLHNSATLYHKKGDYAQAEALYRRALEIRERRLGPAHPDVATSLYNLAALNRAKGDTAQAVRLLTRCNDLREEHLRRTLGAGSERQKLAYLNTFERETNDTISLHAQDAPRDPAALNLAFTTLLRRKGRGLDASADALAQLRRHATETERDWLDQLAGARSQLAAMTLRGADAGNLDTYSSQSERLAAEIDRLEAALSARSPEFGAPVSLGAVQAAIPPGAALVEFARYRPRASRSGDSGPPRYVAYALTHQGEPRWVELGEAGPIDRATEAWRESLGDPDRKDARRLARDVDERIMRPVRALLGQSRHVLVSPDGALNLIPFAALLDEQGQYLIKRYLFTYLTSGRDLLRLQSPAPSHGPPLIVAAPEFGGTEAAEACSIQSHSRTLAPGSERINFERLKFQTLPQAMMDQALRIKNILPKAADLTGDRATETALKQARRPGVLHIITHAFFLPDLKTVSADTSGVKSLTGDSATRAEMRLGGEETSLENRWLRSGLALAGANLRRSGEDDGLLTALEAAGLDLRGTRLVTLTACETGLGKVENGEGVYGLRRALVLAGAESQVVTLWKISAEEVTSRLMTGYYQSLRRGEGRGQALRQAQLKMVNNPAYQSPYFWAGFIHVGEWANLDGQRPISAGAAAVDGRRARQSQTTGR